MGEMKEKMKEIKVPALTKNDWIARMFFYNNKFDKKFYSLLLDLTKYLEFDASERAYEYHFNIRHSQRFVDNIDTMSEYSYETFKLAITRVYIGTIIESEVEDELRLDVLLKWDADLEKDEEYQTIAKNLYNSYCLNIAINKAKSQGPISIFSEEVNFAAPGVLKTLQTPIRFVKPKKKEEGKKDMKETKNTTEESTFFREFYKGLSPETKQILKGLVLHESEHDIFSENEEEEKKNMGRKEIKAKIIIGGPIPLDLKALQKEFGNIKTPKNGLPTVNRICINKDTNMTMLQFSNGDSISVYRDPEDQEDLEKAVAIAMVKYAWGYLENEKAMKRVVNATKKPKNKKKPGELKPAFLAPHDELKKKKVARRKPVEEAPKDETPKKTTHRKPGPKKPKLQDILDHLVESEH